MVIRATFSWLVLTLLVIVSTNLYAQDISKLPDEIEDRLKNPIKISGSLSADFQANRAWEIDNRITPFSYIFRANLNVNILGVSIPFFTNYSNGQSSFNYKLPSYNIVGLSPSYKWAKLHLGRRSMEFSPYTLSGHSFKGYGIELNPDKFYFGAMYGDLKKARPEDLSSAINRIDPVFKRLGWGVKMGYRPTEKEEISLILFNAQDDISSIPALVENDRVKPKSNSSVSVVVKKALSSKLSAHAEYCYSGITRDLNFLGTASSDNSPFLDRFLETNASTTFHSALRGGLELNTKKANFNINYERVDPGFQTLGAFSFKQDFENIMVGVGTSLLKKTLSIRSQVGLERNNLANTKYADMNRLIINVQTNYSPNKRLNLGLNFSNLRNAHRSVIERVPFVEYDSLVLIQSNQNLGFNLMRLLDEEGTSILMYMSNYTQFTGIENDVVLDNQGNKTWMNMLNYTKNLQDKNVSYSIGAQHNYQLVGSQTYNSYGLNSSLSKSFSKTLTTGISGSYTYVLGNAGNSDRVLNINSNLSFKPSKAHNLNLRIGFINSANTSLYLSDKFSELQGKLSYRYTF